MSPDLSSNKEVKDRDGGESFNVSAIQTTVDDWGSSNAKDKLIKKRRLDTLSSEQASVELKNSTQALPSSTQIQSATIKVIRRNNANHDDTRIEESKERVEETMIKPRSYLNIPRVLRAPVKRLISSSPDRQPGFASYKHISLTNSIKRRLQQKKKIADRITEKCAVRSNQRIS